MNKIQDKKLKFQNLKLQAEELLCSEMDVFKGGKNELCNQSCLFSCTSGCSSSCSQTCSMACTTCVACAATSTADVIPLP